MTRSQTQYFEEKIKGITTLINAQFLSLDHTLCDLKDDSAAFRRDIDKLKDSLFEIKLDEKTHVLNCPVLPKIENTVIPDIENINKDLEEYRLIKRYPKLTLILLLIVSFVTIFNIFEFQGKVKDYLKGEKGQILTEKKYDQLIQKLDSLNIKL
jgi:hypothetical protein